jgi:hypothetical protein
MNLNELRIRAMDGSVLVNGRFTLHGDPAVLAHFAIPELAAIGINLRPQPSRNWSLLGLGRIEPGPDGLYAASNPAVTLELTDAVPSLPSLAGLMLPFGRTGFSLVRKGEVRLGSVNVPLAQLEPDKSPSCYLQFDRLDLEIDASAEGLQIKLVARVATIIGAVEGLDVAGLVCCADMFVPAQALVLQQLPKLAGRVEDQEVATLHAGELPQDDLGVSAFGGSIVAGQVDWGQSGDRYSPQGPFVALSLSERRMNLVPIGELSRRASGQLGGNSGSSSGPCLHLNLGREDLVRMLEFEDQPALSLRGSGIGYIEGRTGRDAYLEGTLRQELDWLTLTLDRSAAGLRIQGSGEFRPGQQGQSPNVGTALEFTLLLPRRQILARGLRLPRFWDDWKRELGTAGIW